jgi:hypothetical protein
MNADAIAARTQAADARDHCTIPGRPIFIGGDGRSGTTLLNVVLDSHPELSVGPEFHFNGPTNLGPYALECLRLIRAKDRRVIGKALNKNLDLKPGVQFVRRVERAGIEIEAIERLIMETMEASGSDLQAFPERCALIHAFGEFLRVRDGKKRWGFKIMKEIKKPNKYAAVFPEAQFLHIIRDGRDVAASQMTEHGSWGYGDIEAAARGWVNIIRLCRKNGKDLPVLEVKYEDLVLKPRPTIERICAFLGVTFDETTLRHSEVDHAFFHTHVRHPSREATQKPINDSAVGRHKRDLTPEQIAAFEGIAAEQLREFGYLPGSPAEAGAE